MVRRNILIRSMVAVATVALIIVSLAGCSEERKREAVRLAAELEAKERGETLAAPTDSSTIAAEPSRQAGEGDTAKPEITALVDSMQVSRSQDSASLGDQAQNGSTVENLVPDSAVTSAQPQTMPPMLKEGYTVQVESSPSQSYIMEQVKLFTDRGYNAYLGTVTKEDKTYYRLRIGKYADREEAARVSTEINTMYNQQSWVDKASW